MGGLPQRGAVEARPGGPVAAALGRHSARGSQTVAPDPWFPEVAELHSTEAVHDLLGDAGAGGLVLHEGATVALATVDLPAGQDLVVVIGPEGGIAPDELTAFTSAGATPVRLGRSVLRTSTAGVAALAALSVRLARWS